jgi:hypothetical protein
MTASHLERDSPSDNVLKMLLRFRVAQNACDAFIHQWCAIKNAQLQKIPAADKIVQNMSEKQTPG